MALKVATPHKIKDPYPKNLKREPPFMVSLQGVVSVGDFYCLVLNFYTGWRRRDWKRGVLGAA